MTGAAPIGVIGAGAFGTAMAVALAAAGRQVTLWGRDGVAMDEMAATRINTRHLPGVTLPEGLRLTGDIAEAARAPVLLMGIPTQALRGALEDHRAALAGRVLVLCCKGVERGSGLLPGEVVESVLPGSRQAILSGPSFAADIARGKPTALTLATQDGEGAALQALLSPPGLRLYLGSDPVGAQLGGALKNVVAIAAGIAIGAGFGDSARSALMTRGFAELVHYATARGARRETLFGLSGFGDLVLTCTSTQSRNLRHGLAIGSGAATDPAVTVEGVMTAHAVAEANPQTGAEDAVDLPVTRMVSSLLKQEVSLDEAARLLLSRPLRNED